MPDKGYKYIYFVEKPSGGKTKVFACINNRSGAQLGSVHWYGAWRQYCYFPAPECVYNAGCLDDISEFIGALMKERRKNDRD